MEESGYTRSYRRRWEHPAFRNLRDAGIWSWMTDSAAWRDTAVRFCGQSVQLKRGQLVTSERFLAEGFCVDRQVIRRLMDNLVREDMVSLQKTHGGTIITICNYDVYQAPLSAGEPPENPSRTHDEPSANPNKKEGKEGKEFKKYKFEGRTIRLTEGDYDRWRKSFYAITDFDAELTRIDATVEGKEWFGAAANKLNFKHQELLRAKAEKTPAQPLNDAARMDAIGKAIKRAYAEKNKVWISRITMTDARKVFDEGLVTPEEAAYSGYIPGDNAARETLSPTPTRAA